MLKHRAASSTAGTDESSEGASDVGQYVGAVFRAVSSPFGSTVFFTFRVFSLVLLMPDSMQAIFVDDFVKGLFAVIAIMSDFMASAPKLLIAAVLGGAAALVCTMCAYCCWCHKPHVHEDSDEIGRAHV